MYIGSQNYLHAVRLISIFSYIYIYIYRKSDNIKRNFSQAAVVSILLYGCPTWTLTRRMEIKLDGNCTRMLN